MFVNQHSGFKMTSCSYDMTFHRENGRMHSKHLNKPTCICVCRFLLDCSGQLYLCIYNSISTLIKTIPFQFLFMFILVIS